jgi:hypothetical protein
MYILLDGSGSMGWDAANGQGSRFSQAQTALPMLVSEFYQAMNGCSSDAATCTQKNCCPDDYAQSDCDASPVYAGNPTCTNKDRCCDDTWTGDTGHDQVLNGSYTRDGALRTALLQWSSDNNMVTLQGIYPHAGKVMNTINTMPLQGGGTYWAQSLCQCWKTMTTDPSTVSNNASKMCVLLGDGSDYSGTLSYSSTHTYCGELVTAASQSSMTGAEIEAWVKAQSITIFGIAVMGKTEAGTKQIYRASSCSPCDGTDASCDTGYDVSKYNNGLMNNCSYFLQLDNFGDLTTVARKIAQEQKALLTTTTTSSYTETDQVSIDVLKKVPVQVAVLRNVTENVATPVTLCNDNWMYALLALVPLLLYLLTKPVSMLVNRNALKKTLERMIDNGEIKRSEGKVRKQATRALLPGLLPVDIDFAITRAMFHCFPCLMPVTQSELNTMMDKGAQSKTTTMAF